MHTEYTTDHGLILCADVLEGLDRLHDNSVDAVVVDPPYDLLQGSRKGSGRSNNPDTPAGRHGAGPGGFMGLKWDATGVAFRPETWAAVLRVLKPGGHLVVFGGSRTYHRMTCAVEDAGFEIRDSLLWLYGQGFPKSYDVAQAVEKLLTTGAARRPDRDLGIGRRYRGQAPQADKETGEPVTLTTPEAQQWEGWGTALKPAFEPLILARKPLSEKNMAANVLKWSTGGLNIDGCRLPYESEEDKASATPQGRVTSKEREAIGARPDAGRGLERVEFQRPAQKGRWPPNVMFECICEEPVPLPEELCQRVNEPSQDERYTERGATNLAAKPGSRRAGGGLVHTDPACPAAMLDAQTGVRKSGKAAKDGHRRNQPPGKGIYGGGKGLWTEEGDAGTLYGDQGGASRFFYCAKASRAEREAGCDSIIPITGAEAVKRKEGTAGLNSPRAGAGRSVGTGLTKRDRMAAWVNEALEALRQEDMVAFLEKATEGFSTKDDFAWNTMSSGRKRTGRSRQVSAPITRTGTSSTTDSKTSNSLTLQRTSEFIRAVFSSMESGLSPADFAVCRSRLIEYTGTSAKKAGRSMDDAVAVISERLWQISEKGGLPSRVGVRNFHPT